MLKFGNNPFENVEENILAVLSITKWKSRISYLTSKDLKLMSGLYSISRNNFEVTTAISKLIYNQALTHVICYVSKFWGNSLMKKQTEIYYKTPEKTYSKDRKKL